MKKIAVFTSNVYEPMSVKMQKGIIDAAYKENVKVIFFASFSDSFSSKYYKEYSRYDAGDNVSFDIPDLDDFDGAIRISTFFSSFAEEHLDNILTNSKIPVVNIGGIKEQYTNIGCDDVATFAEIVEHLVREHECKDIYHVAGLTDKYFTHERIDAYRSVLEKNGIPFDSKKIFYGNLWRDCGEAALDYILEHCRRRGKKLPDAILCANDYSAVGVINACKDRGIRVPQDVIVTGYDGVDEAIYGLPTVTTSCQPHFNEGYQAVVVLKKMIDGNNTEKNIRIKGEFIPGQSCGCVSSDFTNREDYRERYIKLLDNINGIAQSSTSLMMSVSEANNLEECFQAINANAKRDTGFKDMLLCLAPGWDKQRVVGSDYCKVDEDMMVVAGFRGENDIPFFTFSKKDILPKDMLADPNPYYVFAIHQLQNYMGYLIVTPEIENRDQKAMQSWFVNIGVILESRRIRRDLKASVARLQYLSDRDMLTELYNRRGMERFFESFHKHCNETRTGLAVIMIDMDDLKKINDGYGHNEGDQSIKIIGNALKSVAGSDVICARTGGDEFVVIAKDFDLEKADRLTDRIKEEIAKQSEELGETHPIGISAGAYVECPGDDTEADIQTEFERYLKKADEAMYADKRQRKTGRS